MPLKYGIKPVIPVINRAHPLARGLVFAVPFFERGGLVTRDIATKNNGAITKGTGGWGLGPYGHYFTFDGAASLINCGHNKFVDDMDLGPGAGLTISVLESHTGSGQGTFGWLIGKVTAEADTEGYWEIYMDSSDTRYAFKKDYQTTNLYRTMSAGSVASNVIEDITLTWDGSATATNLHFYVNNSEPTYLTTTNGAGTKYSDAAQPIVIGNGASGGGSFAGNIYDVKIWNRVLNSVERQMHYNNRWSLYKQTPIFSSFRNQPAAVTGRISQLMTMGVG